MVELVYKFDEKSTAIVLKGVLTAKVPFFGHIFTHINGHQHRPHNPLLTQACAG